MARATILEDILAHKRSEISLAKSKVSLAELESRIVGDNPARGFANAIRQRVSQRQPAVIAEIKKASPSKGLIRADFNPVDHARDYAANGTTCLSILTDQKFFQGCNDYLQQARAACQLPVIRKDFMIDPYQIAESKALGADCILLIVAALQQSQLLELSAYAGELSIDVLVEVHNRQELDRALELDTDLLGINNRNLHTFETDLHTTLDLAQHVPEGKLIITESGINTTTDVASMMSHGIYGFLIGESFMRAPQPGAKLHELFSDHA
ncbi:MAG: indole-3-glycerol phosphate synthase TrpC [Gammaproteobacteria bacterium]|nr:indole-3-glycerol phosphate synthase TrpC [Gammaproteobacteria bacterium]